VTLLRDVVLDPELDYLRGMALFRQGKLGAALRALDESLTEDGAHLPAWVAKIQVLLHKEEIESATDSLTRLRRLPQAQAEPWASELESLAQAIRAAGGNQ
jgi:hypothetical protein